MHSCNIWTDVAGWPDGRDIHFTQILRNKYPDCCNYLNTCRYLSVSIILLNVDGNESTHLIHSDRNDFRLPSHRLRVTSNNVWSATPLRFVPLANQNVILKLHTNYSDLFGMNEDTKRQTLYIYRIRVSNESRFIVTHNLMRYMQQISGFFPLVGELKRRCDPYQNESW